MISGIHHITAITADAQKNIDFYCGVLGLRLVKLTVNFDDPESYHLYYGDALGRPGTILTFFAWPGASRGRVGPPQVSTITFAVPEGSLEYWKHRLEEEGVDLQTIVRRFGREILPFADPDGLHLELVVSSTSRGEPWPDGPVPSEMAIRGIDGVTMTEEAAELTAKFLTEVMGFRPDLVEQDRHGYRAGEGEGVASRIELLGNRDERRGSLGAGVVHHIAFRTPGDAQQVTWREELVRLGYNVSPVMDRIYFHSIYFREPGGVLFEIATDTPGFSADESAQELGTRLMLPPWLEAQRAGIKQVLPPVRLPRSGR